MVARAYLAEVAEVVSEIIFKSCINTDSQALHGKVCNLNLCGKEYQQSH